MTKKTLLQIFFGVASFAVFGLFPFAEALAQNVAAPDANTAYKTVAGQLTNVPKLIAVICYVIGSFYTARCLLALKRYITDPDENPINAFISYGAIGSLLIVLPYSISVVGRTFAMEAPVVESSQKTFEDETQYGMSNEGSVASLFTNLSSNFIPLAKTLAVFAYVMAAAIMLIGLLHLKNYGDDPSQVPVRSIVMKFILASMLVSLPFAMQIFVTTVTGVDSIEDQGTVGQPCLMAGSGLSKLRGSGTGGCQ
jgi:hypothetical protein